MREFKESISGMSATDDDDEPKAKAKSLSA
jgi:hypothetical protein